MPDSSSRSPANRSISFHASNPLDWSFGGQQLALGEFPLLMGIVNVTPDSFSDGGMYDDPQRAIDHALQLVEDGADLLDIGGESTRPGSDPVSAADELRRVIPVIEKLASIVQTPISVDTTKSAVAREAIAAGAHIINDISGLTHDAHMTDVCCETDAGVICMHMQGTPQTMQQNPHYDNVVTEIGDYFRERIKTLTAAGIAAERIVIDPGIGFGKMAEHNLQILSHIASFRSLGRPVLIGHSRKRFLKSILGREVEERLMGTIGVSLALALQQTDILRVHDVASHRDALTACRSVLNASLGGDSP